VKHAKRIAWLLERLLDKQVATASVVAIALLLALQIPGIDPVLEKIGIIDNDRFRNLVVVLVLTSVLLQLRDLYKRHDALVSTGDRLVEVQRESREQLADLRERQAAVETVPIHYVNPADMYDALLRNALSIAEKQCKWLEVLGLTLYSAWPELSFMLQRPEAEGWHITIATLSPDYRNECIPPDWPDESRINAERAREFAASRRAQERGITVDVRTYSFTPAVHGFRLGNGDVYISTLLWDENNLLGKEGFSYEYVPASTHTASAEAFRRLFDNWMVRALSDTT
jgi:hypothetical protein